MIPKLLITCILLFDSLFATEYPETFSKLGTPLYKSLKPISKYSDIKLLEENILTFEQLVGKTIAYGFKVDKSKDKKEIKQYLLELRELQKRYDYLLHILHDNINKSINNKEYSLFIKLTSHEFDGLLKNRNLREKAIDFYKNNKNKKRSKFLDKKIKREKLIKESASEIYNQTVSSSYNPNSKIDSTKTVFISTEKIGNFIYVGFTNRNMFDVTINVKHEYKNIKESENTPKEFVLKANSAIEYTRLELGQGNRSYRYGYSWIIGNKDAVHDDSYVYRLPYKERTSHVVSQGYNTSRTHKDSSRYAIDFAMKEGTRIYAARGGIVVKTKSDSNKHGYAEEFAKYGNYVTIAHDDGTLATYYHLKQRGVIVSVGDRVRRGYSIGYSGNTGYSSGPHLHFAVFSAINAKTTNTIPVKFSSVEGVIKTPKEGAFYTAN